MNEARQEKRMSHMVPFIENFQVIYTDSIQ